MATPSYGHRVNMPKRNDLGKQAGTIEMKVYLLINSEKQRNP